MLAERRRILVTGGVGFIGYHLARVLAEDPTNDIVLVDNLVRGRLDEDMQALVAQPNVALIRGDLTDPATCERLGNGYQEVYHLAAILGVRNVLERPHEVLRVNAIATLHLLDWFGEGGGERLVFASTSETYAWTQQYHTLPIPTPEDVPLSLTDLGNPRSSYAASKIFGELAVTQYCGIYHRPFGIVRYHNIYGPRMGNDHVIPELYCRASGGQNPLVVYSANHSRAFCYVSDAVTATIGVMREERADGRTINVGNDMEEITIVELAKFVLQKAEIRADIAPQTAVSDPVVRRCPDISRARELLGYEPLVALEEGLELTLAWYAHRNGSLPE